MFMIIKNAHQYVDSLLNEHLDPSNWVDLSIKSRVVNKIQLGRIHFLVRYNFLGFP